MDKTAIYYVCVTFLAIATCWILITALGWPLLAEIPLAVSLFLHILALSKKLYEFWTKNKKKLESYVPLIAGEFWERDHSEYSVDSE